jgi:hypothetical protein
MGYDTRGRSKGSMSCGALIMMVAAIGLLIISISNMSK